MMPFFSSRVSQACELEDESVVKSLPMRYTAGDAVAAYTQWHFNKDLQGPMSKMRYLTRAGVVVGARSVTGPCFASAKGKAAFAFSA